ncbi:FRG domain-containing protein [Pseudomonas protegens]|uniref:FRG domain-containing protein n=1 Tax=Pseudomonas protegens TaxID=380021 RepID=UPI001B315066|nr:FRG domain-containing protein [Pseudomonas protegens]MBP5100760.1 FRG domain-containing protein [Pseudomonas protegens]QTU05513.1 FRG domain-containing protein [Pseudomonas protegens]QTU11824.1 FRG domain-containing protein [Pseudomonas protegens]QTU40798.1 FRG domain-containing protein [Pseudomonas protegens]
MASPIEKPFETARELIDFVSPLNPIWDEARYIFRGQASDRYKLTPSVCRGGEGSFAYGSPRRMLDKSSSGQVGFELEILKRFLEGCDKAGLVVPGYSEQVKRKLSDHPFLFPESFLPWPPEQLYEIMAVAQHYDVPTRLLDWTERSFVACYFAASSANFELDNPNMRIAIWALDTTYHDSWNTVKIIRTPGGTSRNQAAQSGLFTTHNVKTYGIGDEYQTESLDDVDEIYSRARSLRPLIKMTLPVSEAPELLEMLSKLGVDGSTLFPGYHGVAKMVKDWANLEVGVRMSQSAIDEYNADSYDHDPDFH